jgi:hypothetical protein
MEKKKPMPNDVIETFVRIVDDDPKLKLQKCDHCLSNQLSDPVLLPVTKEDGDQEFVIYQSV